MTSIIIMLRSKGPKFARNIVLDEDISDQALDFPKGLEENFNFVRDWHR